MNNGTYQALSDTSIVGFFSMVDIAEGQIVSVKDGDHDNTAFVECGPFCTIEIMRDYKTQALELID